MVVADTNYRVAEASGIFVFLVYISRFEWDERGCVTVPPVKDTARFIETRCGKCADICMSGRSKTLEESFDTKNKGASPRSPRTALSVAWWCRLERASAASVAAGVRLIVVSNRLYSGILIRSQLSVPACLRDEQNVQRVLRKVGFKRRASERRAVYLRAVECQQTPEI